ncbi:MAG: hypothetical protein ACM3VZ_09170 [Acidobacteriota bacterium]
MCPNIKALGGPGSRQSLDLMDENAIVARELARAQQRCQQLVHDHAQHVQRLEQLAMRLRADLIRQQTELSQLRDQLAESRPLLSTP